MFAEKSRILLTVGHALQTRPYVQSYANTDALMSACSYLLALYEKWLFQHLLGFDLFMQSIQPPSIKCKIIFRDKARKSSLEGREVKTSRVGNAIRSRQDTFFPRAATPLAETRGDLEGLGFLGCWTQELHTFLLVKPQVYYYRFSDIGRYETRDIESYSVVGLKHLLLTAFSLMSKRSWSVANAAQGLLDMNSVIGIGS